ncbi:hypothetical protein OGAPHI_004783 [Ogataea philodendri]|uniref:Uncharacterized protein n=1 Tax=Ogataea philodendri TaxID=1378263 RepID=A0A9P8T3D3_9ASCO|nr:uncharacterized protein OGAPHI_004783 [Ogataea philodendri]KAH3664069.1 hypothetical protein OGAPHI_004783 [Ogataea philodendri]
MLNSRSVSQLICKGRSIEELPSCIGTVILNTNSRAHLSRDLNSRMSRSIEPILDLASEKSSFWIESRRSKICVIAANCDGRELKSGCCF